jgi:hypothetical protein
VPRITPNTLEAPAAAPSAASDSVVHDANGSRELLLQVCLQRPSDQPRGVGVLHETRVRGDDSRDSDSDRGADVQLRLDSADELPYGADCLVIATRSGDALTREDDAGFVERNGFDLGAAEVDADAGC